jgi:hypothetical protein
MLIVVPLLQAAALPSPTHAQCVGILCRNAVRFLRLTNVACGP